MKALLADDNDLYRDVLELALIEVGYKVTPVINGMDALKVLEENMSDSFDLIITDYEMPLMSGTQLIDEILQRNIQHRRIILLAGSLEVTPLLRVYAKYKTKVFILTKDIKISHLKETLFKL